MDLCPGDLCRVYSKNVMQYKIDYKLPILYIFSAFGKLGPYINKLKKFSFLEDSPKFVYKMGIYISKVLE